MLTIFVIAAALFLLSPFFFAFVAPDNFAEVDVTVDFNT
jgi:hypothetical protein